MLSNRRAAGRSQSTRETPSRREYGGTTEYEGRDWQWNKETVRSLFRFETRIQKRFLFNVSKHQIEKWNDIFEKSILCQSLYEGQYAAQTPEEYVQPFSNLYFKKITDRMDSIMKACQKINDLNNSPPYILDILPDIHTHIRKIVNEHGGKMDKLNENDFFQTFIANLSEKCKTLLKAEFGKETMVSNHFFFQILTLYWQYLSRFYDDSW